MRGLAVCLSLLALGCYQKNGYQCTGSNECVQLGVHGLCEPQGYCAFPDPACPSGDRFEQNAGGGFAGQCVAPGAGIDAPGDGSGSGSAMNCGAVGMACCQGEAQACIDNAYCDSGTCKQCITDIGVGGSFTCAIKYDGSVWCSGANNWGQLGTGVVGGADIVTRALPVKDSTGGTIMDASAIALGEGHACVIRTGGTVWCWGRNDDTQIGSGAASVAVATQIDRASDGMPLTGILSISAGHDMVYAIDGTGTAYAWGENVDGQLGDGTTAMGRPQAAPVLVAAAGAPLANVDAVTTNDQNTTCAHTTGNQIYCWGNNAYGTIGDNTKVAKSVPVLIANGFAVATGRRHTCAVETDHTVWCWGSNGHHRMATANGDSLVPAQALSTTNQPFGGVASVIAAGVSCALMMNNDLYCWGTNPHGQVGTGLDNDRPMPVIRADGTPLHDVTKVVANYSHTCAMLADGEALCWGNNGDGEYGDGTKISRFAPASLPLTCP